MNYQNNKYGSARWATEEDVFRAGLFVEKPAAKAAFIGHFYHQQMHLVSDAPGIVIGGSGSGKLTTYGAYTLYSSDHTCKVDPKGELTAISIQSQVRLGKPCYVTNPRRLHGLPHLKVNPWDDLVPGSPSLHADCKSAARDVIPVGDDSDKWWVAEAAIWIEKIILAHVLIYGHVSMTQVYRLINAIRGNPPKWIEFAGTMVELPVEEIQAVGRHIHKIAIMNESPKEASAILSHIGHHMNFLSDPEIADTLGGEPDYSVSVLAEDSPCDVSLIIPPRDFEIAGAFPRSVIGAIERHKLRKPGGRQVRIIIDECAQMGYFPTLKRLATFGRGSGLRITTYWQGMGQISDLYGSEGLAAFFGSSEFQIILGGGVSDPDTAKMISSILGSMSLGYPDRVQQAQGALEYRDAVKNLNFRGGIGKQVLAARAAYIKANTGKEKQRELLTPSEVYNLSPDRMIVFVTSRDIPPILGHKHPYYLNPQVAGYYMPNPHHPPLDSLMIGNRRHKVITAPVPPSLRDWPQYRETGTYSYIQGYDL